jgi:hypothetical protein
VRERETLLITQIFSIQAYFGERGRIRITAGRKKSQIIDHFFCDLGLSGFSGETGLIISLKNSPDRPFWMADRFPDGLDDSGISISQRNQFQQRPEIYPKRTKTLSTKRTLIVALYT